jgi:hypothetical protein
MSKQLKPTGIAKMKRKYNNSKYLVKIGKLKRTKGGLTADDIVKKKVGKGFRYVSKRKSVKSRTNPWMLAVAQARTKLKNDGVVSEDGMLVKKGNKLYILAKSLHDSYKSSK